MVCNLSSALSFVYCLCSLLVDWFTSKTPTCGCDHIETVAKKKCLCKVQQMDYTQNINDIHICVIEWQYYWARIKTLVQFFILKKLHDKHSKRYLASLVPVPLSTQYAPPSQFMTRSKHHPSSVWNNKGIRTKAKQCQMSVDKLLDQNVKCPQMQ